MVKKRVLLLFVLLLLFPLVSGSLKITKKAIADSVVPEINKPAVFELSLTNNGEEDNFIVYSLVGINIKPNNTFSLNSGETKQVTIELYPEKKILETPGTFNFIYKIKGEKSGIQEDTIAIRIINLKDAIEINAYNIALDDTNAKIYVKNKVSQSFQEIKAGFKSAFFDFDKTFPLNANEIKEFEIQLDKNKTKKFAAGRYSIISDIETFNVKEKIENSFKYTEKAGITTRESRKGIVIIRKTTEKINEGNIPAIIQIDVKKNVLTRLFTTFNIEPSSAERKGFFVYYIFQKEIKPSENFAVKTTTSLIYPLILLIAVILIAYFAYLSNSSHLSLKKKVSYVKTKGGEFALKISLIVKAREFVEKITLADKIPAITKLHEKFVVHPDRIDEKNNRIEWQISELQKNEERIFSYIIYSKVAPFGKFELPLAKAFFEKGGKIHEVESNKVFFMSSERADE